MGLKVNRRAKSLSCCYTVFNHILLLRYFTTFTLRSPYIEKNFIPVKFKYFDNRLFDSSSFMKFQNFVNSTKSRKRKAGVREEKPPSLRRHTIAPVNVWRSQYLKDPGIN